MRNFVPASLEESLMKFNASSSEVTRPVPETKYTAHGGWFGVECSDSQASAKKVTKKRFVKGARA
ncbi:hypothetical protein [Desertivirga brevis]|uniref:hypothetical protein n=1 Tax=Desertivirga brevis TaxID=2810310 RepID=UPI001A966E12|nr:hypothetical protein [Pedobacter sp. SYSU D00873]